MELQSDIVASLALAVQQNPVGLLTLKQQRDDIFHGGHGLLVKSIQQGASAIKICHVGL